MRNLVYALIMTTMLMAAALAGCKSRINQENYNQIKVGMKYGEVVELLGEPDKCNSAMFANSCTWGNEENHITVNFVRKKVFLFASKGI